MILRYTLLEIEAMFTKRADFFTHYPTHAKTLELLRNRAENDPDEKLRQWAQGELEKMAYERQ